MKDNRTKVLMDQKNLSTYGITREEWIEEHWKPIDSIGNSKFLSWSSPNKAKAALKQSHFVDGVDYEIVEITETILFKEMQWEDAGACTIKCPNCGATFNDELFLMGKNTMEKKDIKHCPGCGVKIGYEEYFK